MGYMDLLKGIILAQLFFSLAITIVAYSVPVDSISYVNSFSDLVSGSEINETSAQLQSSLEQQANIPVIELGALVFYSGNILLDLLLNFTLAVPEMVGLLMHSFLRLVSIDSYIWATVQMFASVAIVTLYFIGLIELLTNIRSGRVV